MNKEANLLFEISTMRKIVRNHRPVLLLDDLSDNLASHSYLVTWIAYIIAKHENANTERVLLMALSHDIAETRTGDIAWINKRYVKAYEDEAINDIFSKELSYLGVNALLNEYGKRESIESKCVKDADRMAQMILLQEQVFTFGNQQAIEWLDKNEDWINSVYLTTYGKELALAVYHTKVNDWATNLATDKRR